MRVRLPLLLLLAVVQCIAWRGARADIFEYSLSVTNLSNGDGNFTLHFETNGPVTSTGMQTLAVPLATSLGFAVTSFGENASGWLAFSGGGGGIYNTGLIYSDSFFAFLPGSTTTGFEGPGSVTGSVSGDAPGAFAANALLQITDLTTSSAVTPEPNTLCLVVTGTLCCLGLHRRRRSMEPILCAASTR